MTNPSDLPELSTVSFPLSEKILWTKDDCLAASSLESTTFENLVRDRVLPQPIQVGRRRLWHRGQVLDAIDRLAGIAPQTRNGVLERIRGLPAL